MVLRCFFFLSAYAEKKLPNGNKGTVLADARAAPTHAVVAAGGGGVAVAARGRFAPPAPPPFCAAFPPPPAAPPSPTHMPCSLPRLVFPCCLFRFGWADARHGARFAIGWAPLSPRDTDVNLAGARFRG